MTGGPLARATGVMGLLALVPIVVQLAAGSVTPEQAAARAIAVAVVVVAVGRVASMVVRSTLRRVEPDERGGGAADATAAVAAGRDGGAHQPR